MRAKLLGVGLALALLSACSQTQVQQAATDLNASVGAVQAACQDATAAAALAQATTKGGANQTAQSISQYVVAGCATAQAVAVLAANSSSVEWLQQQTAALNAVAATAATPAAPAAPAAPASTPAAPAAS